jgi:hypothetical protein
VLVLPPLETLDNVLRLALVVVVVVEVVEVETIEAVEARVEVLDTGLDPPPLAGTSPFLGFAPPATGV